jgi:hypothetical protein
MVECLEHQRSVKVLSVKTSDVIHVQSLERVTRPCNVGRRLAWGNFQFVEKPGVTEVPPTIRWLLRLISKMFLLRFDEIVRPVTLFRGRSRQQNARGAV